MKCRRTVMRGMTLDNACDTLVSECQFWDLLTAAAVDHDTALQCELYS